MEQRKVKQRSPKSIAGRIARFSANVDAYKTPLGLAVLALGAFLGYTAFKATTGPPFLPKYQITIKVPPDAPPIRKGLAVRVGGTLAGLIQSVEPDPAHHQTLAVVNISKTNFRPLSVDTTAFVRVHSIVYATYLQLTPGKSKQELKNGDTLPAVATSGTDLLEVVQLFDQQAREDLSKTLVNVGFGAAGRGTDLNGAFKDLPETASDTASELQAVTAQPGALSSLVRGLADTASGLKGRRPDDVSALISSADKTFAATADRRAALGQSLKLLRPFEDQVLQTGPLADPALDEIAGASTALTPAIRNLNSQLPKLNTLASLGPQLRKGFGALLGGGSSGSAGTGGSGSTGTGAATSGVANQVLIAARPVVYNLYAIQTALGPLNSALDALLATIDPYLPEITQAGLWLQSATGTGTAGGLNSGAPFLNAVAVFSGHPCRDAGPAPGQAQNDKANADGSCP